MNNSIKFSIIIPAYNSEKYLSKCLTSVINQSYSNYEAIIIDDGSTDKTGLIADKFSQKSESIKVIHQDNAGVHNARIKGIESASGDYICFLDSDDWYALDFLSSVYDYIIKTDCPIVQVGYYKTRFGLKKAVSNTDQILDINIDLINKFINGHGTIDYSLCNKVYKKELLLKGIKYLNNPLKYGEDGLLNSVILTNTQKDKICVIGKALYYYRQGSGVTSSQNREMIYTETMKFKFELYKYAEQYLKDKSVLKSIFIDSAFITKYYAHLITENETDINNKIHIIDEIIFKNPTIVLFLNDFSDFRQEIPQCKMLLKNNAKEYCEYIENSCSDDKLTLSQKIIKILQKFK